MLPLAATVTGAAREDAGAQLSQRLAPRATGSIAVVRRGHHREHRPDDVLDIALPPLGRPGQAVDDVPVERQRVDRPWVPALRLAQAVRGLTLDALLETEVRQVHQHAEARAGLQRPQGLWERRVTEGAIEDGGHVPGG